MYWTTLGVKPWRESVISTSAALFLQGTLWTGHQLVMAENNSVRSSFLASSSAGEAWLHSLTNTFKIIWTINTTVNLNFKNLASKEAKMTSPVKLSWKVKTVEVRTNYQEDSCRTSFDN